MSTAAVLPSSGVALTGRILLALLFLGSGLGKLASPTAAQLYMATSGVPAPMFAYTFAVVAEVGGGLLLLVGYQTRLAAFMLTVFTLAATLLFHGDVTNEYQMLHAFRNLAIVGGLLTVAAFGAGRISIDQRRVAIAAREGVPGTAR